MANGGIAARAEPLLEPGDAVVGTAVVWAARIGRTPKWLTGRHRHSLVLTQRRLLAFERRRRDEPPALDVRLAELTRPRMRHVLWFTQVVVRTHTSAGDAHVLFEFRMRDRATREALLAALRNPAPA